jgi:hypothetical protein
MNHKRALFWHEHIGGNQFRLRIRDMDPHCQRQWWFFDSRTRTIRAASRGNFVLSNQRGYGFRIGVAAVVRQWRGENYQRIKFFTTRYRNIQNNGKKCLDVHGGHDHHHRHVHFWNCHNGMNQGWWIDQNKPGTTRNPYPDGRKF